MYEAFHHLGVFYQGYRVFQDSGMWLFTLDGTGKGVENIATYVFARLNFPVPEDPR